MDQLLSGSDGPMEAAASVIDFAYSVGLYFALNDIEGFRLCDTGYTEPFIKRAITWMIAEHRENIEMLLRTGYVQGIEAT